MGIDWGFAVQVGGVGFATVFVLLVILAVVIWLTGKVVNRASKIENGADSTQKGT